MYVVKLARRLLPASLVLVAACGGTSMPSELDTAPLLDASADAAGPADDAQLTTSTDGGDGGGPGTDANAEPYRPPSVDFPSELPSKPFLLSKVGLYVDMADKELAPDLLAYEPSYALWSDGAQKSRWLRLPAGSSIDNRDGDHWQFPVGAVLFKEFALNGKKLETRVVARTGPGERDYFFGAFVWRDDESDAVLAWEGDLNVRGSEHDVPSVKQCGTCHNGEPGRVLGLSRVQTPTIATSFMVANTTPYRVPGNELEARALGYLHANCGHCHNPGGSARPDTDLNLRLDVAQQTLADTNTLRSTLGVKLQSFMGGDYALRVVAGAPAQSGLYFRMSQRGPRSQMPPIASERVDDAGLAEVSAFIASLPH